MQEASGWPARRPKLLGEVRRACRARQYSDRTADAYAGWVRRYVLFHDRTHPRELGPEAVAAFVAHLANERGGLARPTSPRRLPIVLARNEVAAVLAEVRGPSRLVAGLLYGAGLRLMEALEIRVKDISLERGEIVVRSGKGGHDRLTMQRLDLSRPGIKGSGR